MGLYCWFSNPKLVKRTVLFFPKTPCCQLHKASFASCNKMQIGVLYLMNRAADQVMLCHRGNWFKFLCFWSNKILSLHFRKFLVYTGNWRASLKKAFIRRQRERNGRRLAKAKKSKRKNQKRNMLTLRDCQSQKL